MSASLRILLLAGCLLPASIGAAGDAGKNARSASPAEPAATAVRKPAPVKSDTTVIGDVDFRDIRIIDAVRLASDLSGMNIVATSKVAEQKVTLFLQGTTVRNLIENICRVTGLWYRHDRATNTYLVMSQEEFQRDVMVFRADYTRVLTLKHHNVVSAANAIKGLYGRRVVLSDPVEEGLSITSLGSPLSSRRTAAGGSRGVNVITGGGAAATSGGRAGAAPGGASQGGGTGAAPDTASDRATALQDMSLSRMQAVEAATEGATTRLSSAQFESLDQTREPYIYVTFNRLHNLLMLRTSDEQALKEVEALVGRLDRPARQVLLEMKVLELSRNDDFQSAFDLDFTGGPNMSGPPSAQPRNPLTGGGISAPRVIGGINPFTTINQQSAGLFQLMSNRIRMRVQLLQAENRVNVLATPMLLAANNQPSRLFIGEERVLTTGASASTTATESASITRIEIETEKRDVGNTLIIVPRINEDRTVSLSIDQDSSEVFENAGTVPVGVEDQLLQVPIDIVSTANLQSTVLAKDGLTVAIGGMIRSSKNKKTSKVPLLGDLPGIGRLFRSDADEKDRRELVLVVTPHILESAEEGETRTRERLGALMGDPASDVPRLFDQNRAAPSEPAAATKSDDPADLARAAAARLDKRVALSDDGLLAAELASTRAFHFDGSGRFEAQPLGSWRRGGLWVTALRLSNLGERELKLDTSSFPGAWRAAALEAQNLAPLGAPGSQTRVFLISDVPFERALAAKTAAREVR